jgi:hypothetical protein
MGRVRSGGLRCWKGLWSRVEETRPGVRVAQAKFNAIAQPGMRQADSARGQMCTSDQTRPVSACPKPKFNGIVLRVQC